MTVVARIMELNIQNVSHVVHKYLKDMEILDNPNKKGRAHEKKGGSNY